LNYTRWNLKYEIKTLDYIIIL